MASVNCGINAGVSGQNGRAARVPSGNLLALPPLRNCKNGSEQDTLLPRPRLRLRALASVCVIGGVHRMERWFFDWPLKGKPEWNACLQVVLLWLALHLVVGALT